VRSGASWKGRTGDGCSFFFLKPENRTSREIFKRLVQTERKSILFHKIVHKAGGLFTMECMGYLSLPGFKKCQLPRMKIFQQLLNTKISESQFARGWENIPVCSEVWDRVLG